ncbi:Mitochondrial distribution and morphology protein 12 [Claviceps citrina]|nr:Mitochondrial distribution and morphology protein 12 [Claviceps citrina]
MASAADHSDSFRHHGEGSRHRIPSTSSISVDNLSSLTTEDAASTLPLREKWSVSTLAPTSANTSRPPTRDRHLTGLAVEEAEGGKREEGDEAKGQEDEADGAPGASAAAAAHRRRKPRVDDVQAVFRIRYAGDIRLQLAAEILLDYPMPSFVGIPLKLNITGLSFDGVGVLAKIRRRVHFCFLSPDDALAAVGCTDDDGDGGGDGDGGLHGNGNGDNGDHPHEDDGRAGGGRRCGPRFGGLLQEIKVESEIGERDGGKQSLKNVGKVERFVLEQVRRIFEEEFVYPSFWTFLV